MKTVTSDLGRTVPDPSVPEQEWAYDILMADTLLNLLFGVYPNTFSVDPLQRILTPAQWTRAYEHTLPSLVHGQQLVRIATVDPMGPPDAKGITTYRTTLKLTRVGVMYVLEMKRVWALELRLAELSCHF